MNNSTISGLYFAIKRYALHDGPNIRTTIFFKGCPLRCFWCHNPEGIDPRPTVVYVADRCIGCGACVDACPEGALRLEAEGVQRDQERCQVRLDCVATCPALAQEAVGWRAGTEEVMATIVKDMPFYDRSGGGVTFSGGEPLLQPEALLALLHQCGRLGIHRSLDTTGHADPAALAEAAAETDLILYDCKHMDSAAHRRHTGVGNELIQANLEMLASCQVEVRLRLPLVAGVNDDLDNLRATARRASELTNVTGIDILPYHHSASGKYRKLGLATAAGRQHIPDQQSIARASEVFTAAGLAVSIGG